MLPVEWEAHCAGPSPMAPEQEKRTDPERVTGPTKPSEHEAVKVTGHVQNQAGKSLHK